ncbi:hypothetical protein [Mucilaginibacter paludis]|uniref:Lipoprotein n=1 Tax=Mucilaginibacter paludis DSM 18603 TaxID=714943 RepID=H1YE95_9SPHI|nr:hypothetical protein [Mucilaginibacter paludis]EHQ26158.1 hypothetical protein Mucpa_2018 [Mucilaginibacter paludis DSM 18603]
MKLNLSPLLLLSLILLLVTGCGSPEKKNKVSVADTVVKANVAKPKNYAVVSADKLETSGKAQIKVMAYLPSGFKDKNELELTLNNIYNTYRHEGGYTNFSEPTVVAVYLFETEKLAKTDPSAWLGMLMKGPSDTNPYLSFNDFKVNASLGLKDKVLSKDEIQLAKIKKLLASRGVDMCDLNKTVNDIELNSIHAADKLYPDYGTEHDVYSDKLINKEWKKLERKYRLTKDEIDKACMFATVYCK